MSATTDEDSGLKLLKDLLSDTVSLEGAGSTGIHLDLNERLNDLFRRDTVVQGNAKLPS